MNKDDIYKTALLDTGKIIRIYDNILLAKSPNNSAGYLFVLNEDKKPVKAFDLGKNKKIPKSVFKNYSQFIEYLVEKRAA